MISDTFVKLLAYRIERSEQILICYWTCLITPASLEKLGCLQKYYRLQYFKNFEHATCAEYCQCRPARNRASTLQSSGRSSTKHFSSNRKTSSLQMWCRISRTIPVYHFLMFGTLIFPNVFVSFIAVHCANVMLR